MSDAPLVGRRTRPEMLWWDLGVTLAIGVMLALGLMLALAGSTPRWAPGASAGVRSSLVIAPLAVFVALYLLLGRRVLRRATREEVAGRGGPVFLVGLLAGTGYAVFTEPLFATLQAIAYPMLWNLISSHKRAVLWSAALALVVSVGMFAGIATVDVGSGIVSAAFSGPISFVFAVAMGTWITRIYTRGEGYRELAEQLRDSQQEVAALSQAAGAAAERERLSRELHDTLTQTLTGLVMLSEQAERALGVGNAELAQDRLARVGAAAREAVAEARALVATTQPLADGGLVASIERVAERLRADTGLRVWCELEVVPLGRELEVVLLRAAQEGMANARRHARAASVTVALSALEGGGAMLVVEDDGVGPGESLGSSSGFGLSGLTARVGEVGGTVEFGAAHGAESGARLEVRVPAGLAVAEEAPQ